MMNISHIIEKVKSGLRPDELAKGEEIFHNSACFILSQSAFAIEFRIEMDAENYAHCKLSIDGEEHIVPEIDGKRSGWNSHAYACLLEYCRELEVLNPHDLSEHKKYSREGMIERVMEERKIKASHANYRIRWADNIYGNHTLFNEKGIKYKVFLRDFNTQTGYSDSADSKYNKLGTTKHIIFAFNELLNNTKLYKRLLKKFPFIEIYCDPLNDYKISWYYPEKMSDEESLLIDKYFHESTFIEEDQVPQFLDFIKEAEEIENICIRPEVKEKVERHFDELMLQELHRKYKLDFSKIKGELFPYQKEGVEFALFRKAAIIADEMGLGKTLQAIATAILKKEIFGFSKTLIVCPATLKSQWKKEIEKFTHEKALIVTGFPDQREELYQEENYHFFIVNYEMVLRDSQAINQAGFDFLILDEAQKIKNYETKTAGAVKRIRSKHTLIITGTPIENRLIDIYSIINVLDPYFLGPLWEFSYQHCLFDPEKKDKINGYCDLTKLNNKLSGILIRREKYMVMDQLPDKQQIEISVSLSPLQEEYHASFFAGVARIIAKKFLTPYDQQQLILLLNNARMVCDSTYLIDEETNESPKMEKLKEILLEKFDIQNTNRKIIIFSEWIKIHKIIAAMLRENKIGFVELNGKVPVKLRGELIKEFEENDNCKIFLSTEAGGAGLNLQVADMLINFELPWNPAKKNQRIGRIDRLGQKSKKLTIYNFVSRNSIEQQIADGLIVKQSLFDSVLSDSNLNFVDFSTKGRSQFIQQIEAFIQQQQAQKAQQDEILETVIVQENIVEPVQLNLFEEDTAEEEARLENFGKEAVEKIEETNEKPIEREIVERQAVEMEQVMNNGIQFLAGMFKMATGKDMNVGNQKIEIDRETGEVVMRFKLG